MLSRLVCPSSKTAYIQSSAVKIGRITTSSTKTQLQIQRTMATSKSGGGDYRVERDTFGELNVPSDKYYGAQTAR